ncbi:phage shock envelope stress response protein PspM [Amycolatopsis nigrescens]|uniref:phage shock envelope stress response protein PspM n=1 Tax=Amycolatopsis nigrescens TaxID=381445 RepID=UPI00037578D2|nr:hypothetical protein [Amycolatopsis nigrescens]
MGSGKRDFSKFNEKLEQHIERLPDYAQRAQEKAQRAQAKVQRYFPPADQRQASDRPETPAVPASPERPARPRMPMPAGVSLPADLPGIAEVRSKWERWNEPAAKLERRKRRTSRALTLWIVLTILFGLYAVAGFLGFAGMEAGLTSAFSGIAGVVVFGALGVRSGTRLHQLKKVQLPAASAAPPPLPPASSSARAPMERLAESEASLAELLRQLATPSSVGTTAVPEVSVEDAQATAAEAAAALRGLAARIQAIERAKNTAPEGERTALESAISTLREQLDDGLEGYGTLVAAAGRAVAASSGGVQTSKEALTDATDRLAGLAIALRELS